VAEIKLWTSDRIKIDVQSVKWFMQQMISRLVQGQARYGEAGKTAYPYLSKLKLEVKAYERTGNQEHLINIANYCWLEKNWPEHKKAGFDPTVKSVTRGRKEE
jgi:hypothetical protein